MSAVGPTQHQEGQILIFFWGVDCKHRAKYAVFAVL